MEIKVNKILDDKEIKVFTEAVKSYFSTQTTDEAIIKTAFLSLDEVKILDFTGVITLSGAYQGCIYFTSSKRMLIDLLWSFQEPDISENNLMDVVGEIANTISGNARKYFGQDLEISVPISISGKANKLGYKLTRNSPLTIAIQWKSHEAFVVVDIDKV